MAGRFKPASRSRLRRLSRPSTVLPVVPDDMMIGEPGSGWTHLIVASRDLLDGRDATATTLIASQGFVDDNPKVAQAILAGMEDAMALISQDPKRRPRST